MTLDLAAWLMLGLAALFAGLVDAVVGGGGLIQVPALFSAFPMLAPSALFGTNKLSSIWGTAFAARSYARRIAIDWEIVLPASAAALVSGFAGAYAISIFPPQVFRKLLPFILLLVALYVLRCREFGAEYRPSRSGRRKQLLAAGVGAFIGLYDGFFGPGTGSFLIFMFVRWFGLDFLRASAVAKLVNVACNFAALAWFLPKGQPLWMLGLWMAACNVLGSVAGARWALRGGARMIRWLFLMVLAALILKTGLDAFAR
ncbi:MAG: hypothetical protein RL404_684 [Pseudomonadota bacterium]